MSMTDQRVAQSRVGVQASAGPEQPEGCTPTVPAPVGVLTRERLKSIVLLAATGAAAYLCFRIIEPFLPAITWALVLAILGRPVQHSIAARLRWPGLAAAISVVLVTVLLAAPVALATYQLAGEAADYAARVTQMEGAGVAGQFERLAARNPALRQPVEWFQRNFDVRGELQRMSARAGDHLSAFLSNTAWALIQLAVMLLTLFYFLRDERRALGTIRELMPFSPEETDALFRRIGDTIHATVFGNVLTSLIQGALGALMFWWLELPAPVLWGFVMALAALIPYLGTFVVWAPAAGPLALQGDWGKAAILTAWGVIVVAQIDNLLYPILVGNRLRLHTLVAFFAILGGLTVFGASGIVLGPVIVAVTLALIDVWRGRTAEGRAADAGMPNSVSA